MKRAATRMLCLALLLTARGQAAVPADGAGTIERQPRGVVVNLGDAFLGIELRADNVAHVAYAKDHAFFSRPSLDLVPPNGAPPRFSLDVIRENLILATAQLRVTVSLRDGTVSFADGAGRTILAEAPGGHQLEPAEVQGLQTFHVRQQWQAHPDESLYGLGQMQLGILDLKGYDLDLWQRNTNVVVPFLVSSRGYGIFWENLSFTRFGDLRPFVPIPADCLVDVSGNVGGLTTGAVTAADPSQMQNPTLTANITRGRGGRGAGRGRGNAQLGTRWEGQVLAPATGDYQFQTYSNGGIKVWIDGKLVIDHWRQAWLTEYDQVKVHFDADKKYAVKIESGGDQVNTMQLRWKTPPESANTSLWSEVGDGVDYYFVYGPELDKVVAGYRLLTGRATMLPEWAFGLWQSRQRYETAQQGLDVLAEFRRRQIPFDNLVQDWQYWPVNAWGSHAFDPQRFPDPDAWLKAIHDQHAHLMISVWGKYYPGNANFDALQKAGYLYQPTLEAGTRDWLGYNYTFYDAFNPGARKLFWDQINAALFSKGVDAWWMDATEPDVVQPSPPTLETTKRDIGATALGPVSVVMNAYALMNSLGIYEGQRAAAPDQRVFILTRSGYAGQQRYSAVTWSGDITSTWTAFAKQIPAGLGFCISGNPYWTTDTGGYTMQSRFSTNNPTSENLEEWRELNVRWFQYSTFSPILRVHGELRPREMWNIAPEDHPAYQAELKFDRLRYALLPYVYTVAGDVTQDASTMMRPLVMDFPQDGAVRNLTDEYMFGPAFLVAPVTQYQARSRAVRLPEGASWYDFWSGAMKPGGQTLDAPAPYDALPLFVRAGSIIPFGPELQYTQEKPADPLTLYVYGGADGQFTLYEDDGLTNAYEKGAFSQIPIRWDDARRRLILGKRTGSFTGMLNERTIKVVLVSPNKPAGFSFTPTPDLTLKYNGDEQSVQIVSQP